MMKIVYARRAKDFHRPSKTVNNSPVRGPNTDTIPVEPSSVSTAGSHGCAVPATLADGLSNRRGHFVKEGQGGRDLLTQHV